MCSQGGSQDPRRTVQSSRAGIKAAAARETGTTKAVARSPRMADPRDTDPADQDPRDRDLERRSDAPAVSPWLVICVIVLLGAVVYVVSAMAGS